MRRGNQYTGDEVNVTRVYNELLPVITSRAPSTVQEGDSFDLEIHSNTKAVFSINVDIGHTDTDPKTYLHDTVHFDIRHCARHPRVRPSKAETMDRQRRRLPEHAVVSTGRRKRNARYL